MSGYSEEEHGLLAAGHSAGRLNGRSHFVECLPTLQQFSSGGLHLVGTDGTRRRQQQKEEALQLVVCVCGGQYEWRAPNRILVVQIGTNATNQRCSKRTRRQKGYVKN